MVEQLFVWHHLLAPLVCMAALEHDFAQKISSHPINSIKLTFISAKWASVGILLEPVSFTVTAEGLLAHDALDWIFQDVVANPTYKLGQEGINV